MENGLDRREFRRFDMKLPATISTRASGHIGSNYHLLLTRDISHNGAYFNMMQPVYCDGPVQVEILLEVPTDCKKCIYLYLVANGEVVRREDSGLAVVFSEDFLLKPFQTQ